MKFSVAGSNYLKEIDRIMKLINECTFYTFLWCLYSLQGTLYASGGIISKSLLLLILILSLYYTVRVITKYKLPAFLKVLLAFIGMYVVYVACSYISPTIIYLDGVMEQTVSATGTLKQLLISLLPIFAYYDFGRRKIITDENIQYYILLFLIVTTASFIRAQNDMLLNAAMERSGREEFTNNVAYNFVHIIPLVFCMNKRILLQYASLVYIIIFLLLGMKRGAIIVGAMCILYFVYISYKNANKRQKGYIMLLLGIAIIGIVSFAGDFIGSSDYFQTRVEQTLEGNTSGRDRIYQSLFEYAMYRQNIGQILFGEGLNKTVTIAGNYAHNDWLELLINQGMLGVILYVFYFVALLFNYKQLKRVDIVKSNVLLMSIAIMFACSLFSMSYGDLSLSLTFGLGYSLSSINSSSNSLLYRKSYK